MFGIFKREDRKAPYAVGIDSNPDAPGTDPEFTTERCLLMLMIAAALADGTISSFERREIEALAKRNRSLLKLGPQKVAALALDYEAALKGRNSVDALVDQALKYLPSERALKGFRLAAYAHCVDIIMADQGVDGLDRAFIDDLEKRLELKPSDAGAMYAVLETKNGLNGALEAKSKEAARAALVLVWAAACCDRVLDEGETDEIDAIFARTPLFAGLSEALRRAAQQDVEDAVVSRRLTPVLNAAFAALRGEADLARVIYAICVDVTIADRRLVGRELRFLQHIARGLDIPRDVQNQANLQLSKKNAF